MYVFFNEQTGDVLYTFIGREDLLDPSETNFIEVPDQQITSLAGYRVVDGQLMVDTTAATYQIELKVKVNAERDRRIRDTFVFEGRLYNFDNDSKSRILGASLLASTKLDIGGYFWAGGDPFGWIATDNTVVPMTAVDCFNFGQAALAHERQLIFKAYTLKELSPIPEDFTNDSYWS